MEGGDGSGTGAAAAAEVDSKDLQQQSKALDKLTDRVEDRQLDSTRVQNAMAALASSKEADWNAMRLREKELAAVRINPTDVDIIVNELELDKKVAERTLMGAQRRCCCCHSLFIAVEVCMHIPLAPLLQSCNTVLGSQAEIIWKKSTNPLSSICTPNFA